MKTASKLRGGVCLSLIGTGAEPLLRIAPNGGDTVLVTRNFRLIAMPRGSLPVLSLWGSVRCPISLPRSNPIEESNKNHYNFSGHFRFFYLILNCWHISFGGVRAACS